MCPGRWLDGAQYHVLSYLGESWCRGLPRFPDAFVVGYTQHVRERGGVITWDVPITPEGRIPQPFIEQLAHLTRKWDADYADDDGGRGGRG